MNTRDEVQKPDNSVEVEARLARLCRDSNFVG